MTPYYERNGITIYCGDCLEVMPRLELEFDAVIADLPYGTTACSWDTVIPFEPLWREYKRLIKENRAVVLFGSQPFTSMLVTSNLEWFKYEWVWEKDRATRHLDCKIKPLKAHEDILIFAKKLPVYNPQKTFNHKPANTTRGHRVNDHLGELLMGGIKDNPGGGNTDRYPRTTIKFNTPNHDENGLHPTQKPCKLMSYLIRTYTHPDELIIDNAMGSGTTLLAAQNEGRRAVGIDISESYCAIAVERLRQPSFFSLPTNGKAKVEARQLELSPVEETQNKNSKKI